MPICKLQVTNAEIMTHKEILVLTNLDRKNISDNFCAYFHSHVRGYSSVVEHSTADREVPGSIPGAPFFLVLPVYTRPNCFMMVI